MKKQVIIGLVVAAACLAYVLKDVDFAHLWQQARDLNPLYLLWVNLPIALTFWLRALRWRILLAPVGRFSLAGLTWANLIGFGANNILPARLGELVRAYVLGRLEETPAAGVLATIVVERILDGLMLLVILFVTLLFVDPSAAAGAFDVAYLRGAGYSLLGLYLGVLAVMAALWRWPEATRRLLTGLASRLSARLGQLVGRLLETFQQGLGILGRAGHLPALVAYTALIWLSYLAAFGVFLPAVGLPLRPIYAAMAFSGSGLAAAVPGGPGYVGAFQLAVTWALIMAGAPRQEAIAYSILFWAVQYFPLTAAGLVAMWKKGLDLASLQRAGRDLEAKD